MGKKKSMGNSNSPEKSRTKLSSDKSDVSQSDLSGDINRKTVEEGMKYLRKLSVEMYKLGFHEGWTYGKGKKKKAKDWLKIKDKCWEIFEETFVKEKLKGGQKKENGKV